MTEPLSIGILGPIQVSAFREMLFERSGPIPEGLGGTPVIHLTKELIRRGHGVHVLTLDQSVQGEVVLEGQNVTFHIGPYRPSRRARDFFAAERAYLAGAIERVRPDVLHAHWTYEFALPALQSGIPHVITAHDAPLQVLLHDRTPYRAIRTLMAWQTLRKAHHLTAVSPYVAQHLRKLFGYSRSVEVIPNGLPSGVFELESRRNQTNAHGGITYATVLNGWGRLKNGASVIQAFHRVRSAIPDARLLMFGSGHGVGEAAHQWAMARNLCDGIVFVGGIPYGLLLQRLATEVDVLVHPSLEEANPMTVVEAMALGLPVIGGRTSGGLPWTLDQGGVLVDVKSPAAMAQAMIDLGSDRTDRQRLGAKGREIALTRFHIAAVADQYEKVYSSVMHSSL